MTSQRPAGKADRFWEEKRITDEERVERVEFGNDYGRILYSSAFRRLNGVTQVVPSDETVLFHNRLTHSLKVAQVGALICKKLEKQLARDPSLRDRVAQHGGLDSRVVRAACMAHDLGHPPFGHIAEKALQQILAPNPDKTEKGTEICPIIGSGANYHLPDGFEGNAQTFRIVTKLAFREADEDSTISRALNLTSGTLTALLKYPWSEHNRGNFTPKKKWGYYESEEEIFTWARRHIEESYEIEDEQRTIEAQVMDWADDISYAVHDLEDFFRTGAIPLNLLYSSKDEMDKVIEYGWLEIERVSDGRISRPYLANKILSLKDTYPKRPFKGSRDDRQQLHSFASKLIIEAVDNTVLDEQGIVRPASEQLAIIEFFKQLTWYYVIDQPALGSVRRGEVTLIRELFRDLTAWVKEEWRSGAIEPPDRRAARREQGLPVRLLDYLDVAFSSNTTTGSGGYRENSENRKISRAVVDYIVSLTERQAVELGKRLSGHTPSATDVVWF